MGISVTLWCFLTQHFYSIANQRKGFIVHDEVITGSSLIRIIKYKIECFGKDFSIATSLPHLLHFIRVFVHVFLVSAYNPNPSLLSLFQGKWGIEATSNFSQYEIASLADQVNIEIFPAILKISCEVHLLLSSRYRISTTEVEV